MLHNLWCVCVHVTPGKQRCWTTLRTHVRTHSCQTLRGRPMSCSLRWRQRRIHPPGQSSPRYSVRAGTLISGLEVHVSGCSYIADSFQIIPSVFRLMCLLPGRRWKLICHKFHFIFCLFCHSYSHFNISSFHRKKKNQWHVLCFWPMQWTPACNEEQDHSKHSSSLCLLLSASMFGTWMFGDTTKVCGGYSEKGIMSWWWPCQSPHTRK